MGTTLTAAQVHDGDVSLAHVGDSRAYRMRDGELEQLTNDHSLVAELERSGQITAEAAEHHPQRSIITRALGPEPDVEVDTYTLTGRAGDVFLLCSDGLTAMISDDEVERDPARRRRLDDAAQALIRAANQSGGKDNITVVLFRLGEGDGPAPTSARRGRRGQTIAGAAHGRRRTRPPVSRPRREAPPAVRRRRRFRPPSRRRASPAGRRPPPPPGPAPVPLEGRAWFSRSWCGGGGAGLYALSRQVYFVGTNDAGLVTRLPRRALRPAAGHPPLRRGVRERRAGAARSRRRAASRVLDHEWRSREDADGSGPPARARQLDGRLELMSARMRELFGLLPGLAARDGRLRRGADHAHRRHQRRDAHLRRGLPRPVRGRPTCSSAPACRTPTRTCSRWPRCWRRSGSC